MFKKTDIFLILFCLLISFLPLAIFHQSVPTENTYAEITVDGRLQKRVQLTEHHGQEEIDIQNFYGHNHIIINDDTIAIDDADCPDGLCIKQGAARRPGDVIGCLPHKLMIEIKGTGTSAAPDVIPVK